jgi:hypothetical protein
MAASPECLIGIDVAKATLDVHVARGAGVDGAQRGRDIAAPPASRRVARAVRCQKRVSDLGIPRKAAPKIPAIARRSASIK